jgi:RNA polymerase sigma-70 factor (ECF subfamily)
MKKNKKTKKIDFCGSETEPDVLLQQTNITMELQEFTENAERLRMQMHQQALHYLANPDDSDDVVKEVFIKLWLKRKEIDNFTKMRNLASVVVRNISLNMIRDRRRCDDLDNCISLSTHIDAQQQMEEAENHQRLQRAIGTLSDKQKALIRMRNVEGLSYTDIARMLGTTESSARAMVCKARTAIMNQMKEKR